MIYSAASSLTNIYYIDPSDWEILENKNAGGSFGKFEFQATGDGSSRTTSLSFRISDVAGDTISDYAVVSTLNPNNPYLFASHIAGFEANGIDSAQFAAPEGGGITVVPIPAAAPLFASAMALLGMLGWRRRHRGSQGQRLQPA